MDKIIKFLMLGINATKSRFYEINEIIISLFHEQPFMKVNDNKWLIDNIPRKHQ